ncbi:hypothetical protein ACSZNY_03745 [Aeromonas caviae]
MYKGALPPGQSKPLEGGAARDRASLPPGSHPSSTWASNPMVGSSASTGSWGSIASSRPQRVRRRGVSARL